MSYEELAKAAQAYDLAYQGNIHDGAVLLGQSIGLIDSIKGVASIIDRITQDAERAIQKTANLIK